MSNEVVANSNTNSENPKKEESIVNTTIPSTVSMPSGGTPLKTNGNGNKSAAIKLPSIADIKSGKFELKKEEKKEEIIQPTNEFSYGDFKHYWDEVFAQIAAKKSSIYQCYDCSSSTRIKGQCEHSFKFQQ